ncbi:MAG: trypsin-like peptidase domain-containing protein [Melioribacteraceae bacterium]|nr:trypsin-like peptidase domain-containing protein [Melioribacteraceae bacterium]
MKKIQFKIVLSILTISILIISCKPIIYNVAYPTLDDGKYDSEFPYKSSSKELEEISNSVKLLNCMAFYESYIFRKESKIKKESINELTLLNKSVDIGRYNRTASGSATIIYSESGVVALLTCAHIIDFPDTVYTYYFEDSGKETEFVESISIKVRQNNYIPDFPERGNIEVLISDIKQDIAIVGNIYPASLSQEIKEFKYPIGAAKNLEWGSFVYAFGYPMNYKMISKGLVSSPNRDGNGAFLLDAVFNRGFSGGIILGIKDGVPNFELVGMVTSVAAEGEIVLRPLAPLSDMVINPLVPYNGPVSLERKLNIKYGVTKAVSIEAIREFILDNEDYLSSEGYFLSSIFETDDEKED